MAVSPDDTDIQESRAAGSFSQCTGALSASQGSVSAERVSLDDTKRPSPALINYMDELSGSNIVPGLVLPHCGLTVDLPALPHFVTNSTPPGEDNPL